MKIRFLHFFKLTLALVLFLQVGQVNAQTIPATNTSTVGTNKVPTGWTILFGTPDISSYNTYGGFSGSFGWIGTVTNPPNGHTTWPSGYWSETIGTTITGLTVGTTYNLTFYIAEIQSNNGVTINTTYDGVFEVASYVGSTYTSLATYPFTGAGSNAWSTKTLTFTASATTLPLAFRYQNAAAPQNGNFWNLAVSADAVAPCNAGTTAPTLSATTKATTCPSTTVDLTALLTSTTPAGASLVWYTNNAHTGTAIADATQIATAGTYYAFYFDATNSCYSPASTAIAVTITNCCANVAAPTWN